MPYLIKLRHGACVKGLCALCSGCLSVFPNDTALVNSMDVLCLKYNFAKLICSEIEKTEESQIISQPDFIFFIKEGE